MKRKYLIVLVLIVTLISCFALTAAAEDLYQDMPNQFTYSFLTEIFLEPYARSYCVMEERGVLTFYYPDVKPTSRYISVSGDYGSAGFYSYVLFPISFFSYEFTYYGSPNLVSFEFITSDELYVKEIISGSNTDLESQIKCGDVTAVGFLFPGENLSSVTLSFPYYAASSDVALGFDVDSSSWQPFPDIADVPTVAPELPATEGSFLGILGEIIGILTSGIAPLGEGIGAGLSNLAAAIFLTGTGDELRLSVFGSVIIIFAGVALAIGLSRFVVGWLTSLGASD